MTTGDYISIGLVLFNVLLGLIAFFGGMVVRGLVDSIKDMRAAHESLRNELAHFVRKDDYREDISELKGMIGKLFDRIDGLLTR